MNGQAPIILWVLWACTQGRELLWGPLPAIRRLPQQRLGLWVGSLLRPALKTLTRVSVSLLRNISKPDCSSIPSSHLHLWDRRVTHTGTTAGNTCCSYSSAVSARSDTTSRTVNTLPPARKLPSMTSTPSMGNLVRTASHPIPLTNS